MFCTKCGKESVDGTKFCGGCGRKVEGVVEPVKTNDTYVVAKWKKMKTLPRILVVCGGCFLFFITQIFAFIAIIMLISLAIYPEGG